MYVQVVLSFPPGGERALRGRVKKLLSRYLALDLRTFFRTDKRPLLSPWPTARCPGLRRLSSASAALSGGACRRTGARRAQNVGRLLCREFWLWLRIHIDTRSITFARIGDAGSPDSECSYPTGGGIEPVLVDTPTERLLHAPGHCGVGGIAHRGVEILRPSWPEQGREGGHRHRYRAYCDGGGCALGRIGLTGRSYGHGGGGLHRCWGLIEARLADGTSSRDTPGDGGIGTSTYLGSKLLWLSYIEGNRRRGNRYYNHGLHRDVCRRTPGRIRHACGADRHRGGCCQCWGLIEASRRDRADGRITSHDVVDPPGHRCIGRPTYESGKLPLGPRRDRGRWWRHCHLHHRLYGDGGRRTPRGVCHTGRSYCHSGRRWHDAWGLIEAGRRDRADGRIAPRDIVDTPGHCRIRGAGHRGGKLLLCPQVHRGCRRRHCHHHLWLYSNSGRRTPRGVCHAGRPYRHSSGRGHGRGLVEASRRDRADGRIASRDIVDTPGHCRIRGAGYRGGELLRRAGLEGELRWCDDHQHARGHDDLSQVPFGSESPPLHEQRGHPLCLA